GPGGHLWGAVNIPLRQLPNRLTTLRPLADHPLLVYCRRGPCGQQGAEELRAAGFTLAVLLDGGIDQWVAEGFGTVRPGTPAHDRGNREQAQQPEQPPPGTR